MGEQPIEIALGPKMAFASGSVGTLKRRVTADRVVNVAAKARRAAKPPKQPRTPRVVELLRKAHEWRRQLEADEVVSQAEIARREGVTRARVTQIMGTLRLAPRIQQYILSMPQTASHSPLSEHSLRPIAQLSAAHDQEHAFEILLSPARTV